MVGLLIGLISVLLCLREQGAEERGRERLSVEQSEATRHLCSVHRLICVQFMAPPNDYIVTSRIANHRSPHKHV